LAQFKGFFEFFFHFESNYKKIVLNKAMAIMRETHAEADSGTKSKKTSSSSKKRKKSKKKEETDSVDAYLKNAEESKDAFRSPRYFHAHELKPLSGVRKGDTILAHFYTTKDEKSNSVEPAQVINSTSSYIGVKFLTDDIEAVLPRDFVKEGPVPNVAEYLPAGNDEL